MSTHTNQLWEQYIVTVNGQTRGKYSDLLDASEGARALMTELARKAKGDVFIVQIERVQRVKSWKLSEGKFRLESVEDDRTEQGGENGQA